MSKNLFFILIFCYSCNQGNIVNNGRNSRSTNFDTVIANIDNEFANASVKSDDYFENLKSDSEKIAQFVPKGYNIMDTIHGDLNKDEYEDIAMVLRNELEGTHDTTLLTRPLLLLVGNIEGNFTLAARNDSTVYCLNCGGAMGDPYQGLVIKNGNLSVEHYGGSGIRWERIVTYKYNSNHNTWHLFRDGHVSFHAVGPEKREEKVYTPNDLGYIKFEQFNIYKNL